MKGSKTSYFGLSSRRAAKFLCFLFRPPLIFKSKVAWTYTCEGASIVLVLLSGCVLQSVPSPPIFGCENTHHNVPLVRNAGVRKRKRKLSVRVRFPFKLLPRKSFAWNGHIKIMHSKKKLPCQNLPVEVPLFPFFSLSLSLYLLQLSHSFVSSLF